MRKEYMGEAEKSYMESQDPSAVGHQWVEKFNEDYPDLALITMEKMIEEAEKAEISPELRRVLYDGLATRIRDAISLIGTELKDLKWYVNIESQNGPYILLNLRDAYDNLFQRITILKGEESSNTMQTKNPPDESSPLTWLMANTGLDF